MGLAGATTIALLVASMTAAKAQPQVYSIGAVACAPASQTIDGDLHVTQSGNVRFDGDKSGTLTMFCPITFEPQFLGGNFMTVTALLRDEDGKEDDSVVSVNLRRLGRFNGQISDHPQGQLNSNTNCSVHTTEWQECSVNSPEFLHFNEFYYFFQVTLKRTKTTINVRFGGIRLTGGIT